jgi:dephospho-CoA kinase
MKIIGLTGGIASGKSLVAGFLDNMGAVIIDADRLAREVVMPGSPCYEAIVATFGSRILQADGSIDRKALGKIVFADTAARRQLEQITHPAIRKLADDRLAEERRKGTKVVFYMVPLLIEAGFTCCVDEIWVVYADEKTQLARLMARDRIGRDEALQKIAAQMPMEEKVKLAKIIIDNCGTLEQTERQVQKLWEGFSS